MRPWERYHRNLDYHGRWFVHDVVTDRKIKVGDRRDGAFVLAEIFDAADPDAAFNRILAELGEFSEPRDAKSALWALALFAGPPDAKGWEMHDGTPIDVGRCVMVVQSALDEIGAAVDSARAALDLARDANDSDDHVSATIDLEIALDRLSEVLS